MNLLDRLRNQTLWRTAAPAVETPPPPVPEIEQLKRQLGEVRASLNRANATIERQEQRLERLHYIDLERDAAVRIAGRRKAEIDRLQDGLLRIATQDYEAGINASTYARAILDKEE